MEKNVCQVGNLGKENLIPNFTIHNMDYENRVLFLFLNVSLRLPVFVPASGLLSSLQGTIVLDVKDQTYFSVSHLGN